MSQRRFVVETWKKIGKIRHAKLHKTNVVKINIFFNVPGTLIRGK